ncbi:MAG: hypothetical protein SNG14_02350 [Rikenellaceae bacterium]
MKTIIRRVSLALLTLATFVMCKTDDTTDTDSANFEMSEVITESLSLGDIAQAGLVSDFTINVDGVWSLSFSEGADRWITLTGDYNASELKSVTRSGANISLSDPIVGEGRTVLQISVSPNTTRDTREAEVTVETNSGIGTLTIRQSSAKYCELLYLSMGTSTSATVATMPMDGTGYNAESFAITASSSSIAQDESLVSTSIEGVYSASGSNYLKLLANSALAIEGLTCTTSDIYINFGCSLSSVATASELLSNIQITFTGVEDYTDQESETVILTELSDEYITISTEEEALWGYLSARIPKELLVDGESSVSIYLTAGSSDLLLDDISILNLPTYDPVASLEIEDVAHKRLTLIGSAISIDGGELSASEIQSRGFRYAKYVDESSELDWYDQPITATASFEAEITNLSPETKYRCQSYITLTDNTKIYSVTLGCETTATPTVVVDTKQSVATSTTSIKVISAISALCSGESLFVPEDYVVSSSVSYRLSGSEESFQAANVTSTSIIEGESSTTLTQSIDGLEEGESYEVISIVELKDEQITSTAATLISGVRTFKIGEITTVGKLQVGTHNTDGLTLTIPINNEDAAASWIALECDDTTLSVENSVIDWTEQGYPKALQIKVSGAIATLPESGNITCELRKMDTPTEAQTIRLAVYDTNGDIYLNINSTKFADELAELGIANNTLFGSIELPNGLSIERFSANSSYSAAGGSGLKYSSGITLLRNNEEFNISSVTSPEEYVTLSVDLPYGIEISNTEHQIKVDSKLRQVGETIDFAWTYMMQIPTISTSSWSATKDGKTFNINGLNGSSDYDVYFELPAGLTRSDNHKLTIRLQPYTTGGGKLTSETFSIFDFVLLLDKIDDETAPAAVTISGEVNSENPYTAIDLEATYSNVTETITKYGFIVNGDEHLTEGVPASSTFSDTIDGLSEATTYSVQSILYFEGGSTLKSLVTESVTTDKYVAPVVPTVAISAEASELFYYQFKFDATFTNVEGRDLTPVVRYFAGDSDFVGTYLDAQSVLIADGVESYTIDGGTGLTAETTYRVEISLKTTEGAFYPAVSQSFTTTAKPTVVSGFTITPTLDGVVLSGLEYTNAEQIRRLSYKYKKSTDGSYSATTHFSEINEELEDRYSMTGLDEGTEYIFYWYIVSKNNLSGAYEQIQYTSETFSFTTLSSLTIDETATVADDESITITTDISDGVESITERGVEWSLTGEDSWTAVVSAEGGLRYATTIDGLESGTTYFIRSYVKAGEETLYSAVISTSTLGDYVTLSIAYDVTAQSVTATTELLSVDNLTDFGVEILSDGGETYSSDGVVNSEIDGKKFTSTSPELELSKTYYMRSYAVIDGQRYESKAQEVVRTRYAYVSQIKLNDGSVTLYVALDGDGSEVSGEKWGATLYLADDTLIKSAFSDRGSAVSKSTTNSASDYDKLTPDAECYATVRVGTASDYVESEKIYFKYTGTADGTIYPVTVTPDPDPEPTEPTEPTDPEPTDPEPTDPEPTPPTASITEVTEIAETSFKVAATLSSVESVTACGVAWSVKDVDNWTKVAAAEVAASYSVEITGLTAEAEYDIKSYATYESDDYCSEVQQVTTLAAAVVDQYFASIVYGNRADNYFNVKTTLQDGVVPSSYGVEWRAKTNENGWAEIAGSSIDENQLYTVTVSDLSYSTDYVVRSYVEIEGQRYYSLSELEVTTQSERASVESMDVTPTSSSLTVRLKLTNGDQASRVGIQYRKKDTTSNTEVWYATAGTVNYGDFADGFDIVLSGLEADTSYGLKWMILPNEYDRYLLSDFVYHSTLADGDLSGGGTGGDLTADLTCSVDAPLVTSRALTVNSEIFASGEVTEFGVEYSTTKEGEYVRKNVANGDVEQGAYSSVISELNVETTYFIRSYATVGGEPYTTEAEEVTTERYAYISKIEIVSNGNVKFTVSLVGTADTVTDEKWGVGLYEVESGGSSVATTYSKRNGEASATSTIKKDETYAFVDGTTYYASARFGINSDYTSGERVSFTHSTTNGTLYTDSYTETDIYAVEN